MAQLARHSIWEVGIDFGLGAALNLGIQAVFLRTFTLSRGLGFTGAFLLLALVRRYSMRRGFNWLLRQGQKQSWRMSLCEAIIDTSGAIVIALGLLALWYPNEPLPRISSFIGASYLLTPLCRFSLRRFFEWLSETAPGRQTSKEPSSSMR